MKAAFIALFCCVLICSCAFSPTVGTGNATPAPHEPLATPESLEAGASPERHELPAPRAPLKAVARPTPRKAPASTLEPPKPVASPPPREASIVVPNNISTAMARRVAKYCVDEYYELFTRDDQRVLRVKEDIQAFNEYWPMIKVAMHAASKKTAPEKVRDNMWVSDNTCVKRYLAEPECLPAPTPKTPIELLMDRRFGPGGSMRRAFESGDWFPCERK
jgi:hypothetical protein